MNKIGSNQYILRRRNRGQWKKWLLYYGFGVVVLVGVPLYMKTIIIPRQAHAQTVGVKQPAPGLVAEASPAVTPTLTPTPTETPLQEKEIAYIREVFKSDSDNAIAIARCESGLRPDAVGVNTDGSIDRGLFQLNNKYQLIDNLNFLFDYRINTLMAKKIFDSWGGNFNAWSCNRKLDL